MGDSKNNIIEKNVVKENKLDGFALSFSSNNLLIENEIEKNNIGIFMDFSAYNEIKNNSIISNIHAGLYLFHNSSFNRILNNEIMNNSNFGISISNCYYAGNYCLEGCESNIIEKNKISNNKIGIYSNKSSSTIKSNIICENTEFDLSSSDWFSTYGSANVCDKPGNWKDDGNNGCSKVCEEIKYSKRDDKEKIIIILIISITFIILLKFSYKRS